MEVVREERNVSEMRAEERERWKKGSSKLSHETLQMALQFPEAAHGRGQQEPSKGEAAPAPPHPLGNGCPSTRHLCQHLKSLGMLRLPGGQEACPPRSVSWCWLSLEGTPGRAMRASGSIEYPAVSVCSEADSGTRTLWKSFAGEVKGSSRNRWDVGCKRVPPW